MQEIKDEELVAIDNDDLKLEWRSSRGRGRPRKSLEGAELNLQSAPSAGKRRGRPPGERLYSCYPESISHGISAVKMAPECSGLQGCILIYCVNAGKGKLAQGSDSIVMKLVNQILPPDAAPLNSKQMGSHPKSGI